MLSADLYVNISAGKGKGIGEYGVLRWYSEKGEEKQKENRYSEEKWIT
jgi:hypothetical protein